MKRKYIIGLMAISLLSVVGCEDLDTLPDGDNLTSSQKEDIVANNPEKAEAGINAIFAQFTAYEPNEDALGVGRHNDFGYPSVMMFADANGNDVVSSDNGYNWVGSDLDYSDRLYTSYESQIVWNDMYKLIRTANDVISGSASAADNPLFQFYLGQGLAARAFSYWVLANLYQFNYVGNESKLCVPIITDKNTEEAAANGGAPRATVEKVYTLITTDIDRAINLLDSAQIDGVERKDKRYIDLAVAYGLKARIALTMEEWDDAATAAQNAIDFTNAVPADSADVAEPAFSNAEENNWMWGVIITETDDIVSSGIVNWISHMGSLNWGYANYSKGRQINKALFNTIASTDVRKGWWTDATGVSVNLNDDQQDWMDAKYAAYTQVKFAPYNDEVGTTINANDIPLMRIEEMYLIKAEAQEMNGDNGRTTLKNFITTYRDADYTVPLGDFQTEVFRQRRIELWGEGLIWFDVMRLGAGVDRRGGGYPNATMVFNIAPDDNILLWRIPEAEIQSNRLLNEGDNNPSAPAPSPVADI